MGHLPVGAVTVQVFDHIYHHRASLKRHTPYTCRSFPRTARGQTDPSRVPGPIVHGYNDIVQHTLPRN